MQTFLPYTDFYQTAKVLDNKRLGKQRLEASQILDLVEGRVDNNWKHHPAVRMWSGYGDALRLYYNTMVKEWLRRGYKNNMPLLHVFNFVTPPWLSDSRLPLSHRGNLLRKDPEYYSKFGWTDADPTCPYFWPVGLLTPANQKIMVNYWGKIS